MFCLPFAAITHGNESIRRTDGTNHLSFAAELIDIRPIFVAYPEGAAITKNEPFGVNSNPLPAWAITPKSIASIFTTLVIDQTLR